ncbi:MAG: LysR substrate-binding domain-containing protein [Hyphomicrobiales bacterium]
MQDLNDFYFFAAVVNHGGFSAAARALKLPKSRLSKHVTQLENRLGVRLIERSTRRFKVTELGQEFHRQCEAVVAGAEEAEAIVARARAEPRGTLRVSCPPTLSNHIMAEILPPFMKAHPKVRVQMTVSNRRVDLIEERVDVAIRVRTRLDTDPDLTLRILGNSRLVLVASPAFAAANAGRLTPETVGELPTLSFVEDIDQNVWRLADSTGRAAEIGHQPILACSDINVQIAAAMAGLGVALAPDDIVSSAIGDGRLVQVLPEWTATNGIIHLVFTSKRGLLPATRALIDHLVKEFPAAMRRCRAGVGAETA